MKPIIKKTLTYFDSLKIENAYLNFYLIFFLLSCHIRHSINTIIGILWLSAGRRLISRSYYTTGNNSLTSNVKINQNNTKDTNTTAGQLKLKITKL